MSRLTLRDFSFSWMDEMNITRRRSIQRKGRESLRFLATLAAVVFLLALAADVFLATPMVEAIPAHAAEPVRQNDYYCAHLSDYTNGSDLAFAEICKGV